MHQDKQDMYTSIVLVFYEKLKRLIFVVIAQILYSEISECYI